VESATVASRQRRSWKQDRELEGIEARILDAESARDDLSARLADPVLYQDSAEAARVREMFRAAEVLVDSLYARWAELEALGG
jgi:ATP-binding cassette subfamily F protein uup